MLSNSHKESLDLLIKILMVTRHSTLHYFKLPNIMTELKNMFCLREKNITYIALYIFRKVFYELQFNFLNFVIKLISYSIAET